MPHSTPVLMILQVMVLLLSLFSSSFFRIFSHVFCSFSKFGFRELALLYSIIEGGIIFRKITRHNLHFILEYLIPFFEID